MLSGTAAHAAVPNLTVKGSDGSTVTEYRWLLQEDITYNVRPGVIDPANTVGVQFHKSHIPVVAAGDHSTPLPNLDPARRYFISVLPAADYSLSGTQIKAGQTSVLVTVHRHPLPTAQISVFVFEDNHPINNTPNLPQEQGIAGASILLFESGGRYGDNGGQVSDDAFGNPLGTTYLPNGNVDVMGDGTIRTDASGFAIIKNLAPAKYTILAVPPPDPGGRRWLQTTTIEGGFGFDAWVWSNEPPLFDEGFGGLVLPHVFMGFVREGMEPSFFTGTSTVTGRVVNQKLGGPPSFTLSNGGPFTHTTPWIGLNDSPLAGRGVLVQRANADGTFSITNVPPGTFQLVVFDEFLDIIIGFFNVLVPPGGGTVALGDLRVFPWFGALHNFVFFDTNENGFPDPGEVGIPNQAINLRFRDGTIYKSFTTDNQGFAPAEEVFPFFAWQVAEIDFTRFKATGVTSMVDGNRPGAFAGTSWTLRGRANPMAQTENRGRAFRTEQGPQLLQAYQVMLGQTLGLWWGKKDYRPGENGGVVGIVYYATTRAEDDPRYNAPEGWEPGIPRVTIKLYKTDPLDPKNPAKWVLVNQVQTDSWDDRLPTNCLGPKFSFQNAQGGLVTADCLDGLRSFNQIRPGVFDGGYQFLTKFEPGLGAPGAQEVVLTPGPYITEVVVPPGYEIVKEQDKNVDFGDVFVPPTVFPPVLLPECVGDLHQVPLELDLFPGVPIVGTFLGEPIAGAMRPLCDRKLVWLNDGQQVNSDFHFLTKVPVLAQAYGFVTDDTAPEFNPFSAQFNEKFAPPFLPISVRDWMNVEITRVYTDQFGIFNFLVPSTYTINPPFPSGVSPNILRVCANDSTMADPNNPGQRIPDLFFNPQYGTSCIPFQFMPGTTTYVDLPVVPVGAHAGAADFPLDCEFSPTTPVIHSVTSNAPGGGPYVAGGTRRLTINSAGLVGVPNPAFTGSNAKTVARDFGFGNATGTVRLGGTLLAIVSWSAAQVVADVPAGTPTGQLILTRGDNGRATVTGVTVHVDPAGAIVHVTPGQSIQAAIDAASAGDLILVAPGTYKELVVLWKRLRLQGWGAFSTIIDAEKTADSAVIEAWKQKVKGLITGGQVDLLPSQDATFDPAAFFLRGFRDVGPGVMVILKQGGVGGILIDGLQVTSGTAGGIVVNGFASGLEISNNRIWRNLGFLTGGVRLGDHTLQSMVGGQPAHQDAFNDNVNIHHNQIIKNGNRVGAGGGVGLGPGSDGYQVTDNFICGNFDQKDGGGGIGHLGLSEGGLIARNTIVFNEAFSDISITSGGGVLVAGLPNLVFGQLSPGSGSVKIVGNLIQGNLGSSGDGGGISLRNINGADVAHTIEIYDNMIVNNVAGAGGGGIGLQDAVAVNIINNTIARNDSTASAQVAFPVDSPTRSVRHPAGVMSRAHSAGLTQALGPAAPAFSNPVLENNIIWQNRAFLFDFAARPGAIPPFGLLPNIGAGSSPVFIDVGVVDTPVPAQLDPRFCVLTSSTGLHASNIAATPSFLASYFNGRRALGGGSIEIAIAFDEIGNRVKPRFGPLTLVNPASITAGTPAGLLFGDYHVTAGFPGNAAILATSAELSTDFDGQVRPAPTLPTPAIGADEVAQRLVPPPPGGGGEGGGGKNRLGGRARR